MRILEGINKLNEGNERIISSLNNLPQILTSQNNMTLQAIQESNSMIMNAFNTFVMSKGSSKTFSLEKNNTESNENNSLNSKNNLINKEKESSSGGNVIRLSLGKPKIKKIKKKNEISSQFSIFNHSSETNKREEKRNKSISYRNKKNK